MKKQTISFDLDDTLFDAIKLMVEYSNKHWGTNFKFNKLEDSDRIFPDLTVDEENRLWLRFLNSPYAMNSKPSKEVERAINRLSKNYRLIIVSARDYVLQKSAISWINKFFPKKFDKIIFKKTKTSNIPKSAICLKEKAILHIDDNKTHIIDCLRNGIPAVLVNRPWNKTYKTTTRIDKVSLSNLEKVISKLS